jgi:hypothetical protein
MPVKMGKTHPKALTVNIKTKQAAIPPQIKANIGG